MAGYVIHLAVAEQYIKNFPNDITKRGLIPNIYKQFIQLDIKKPNNLI